MPFRLSTKTIFLTYPNCNEPKEDLLQFLKTLGQIKYAIICKEKHESGEYHLHAAAKYTSKIETRNERYFDFKEHHPNIQRTRNFPASVNYCKKDGDFLEEENVEPSINIYELARETDYETFMETCRKEKISCMYADRAWSFVEKEKNDGSTITSDDTRGTIRRDLESLQLASNEFSIQITGPTGIGKTTWALKNSPKPALWVTHMDDLKKLRQDHKSIIFDDMNFTHLPRTAQIHLVDHFMPRSIHVRYGTAIIPANIVKIFLSNEEIFAQDPAILRRINKYHFY